MSPKIAPAVSPWVSNTPFLGFSMLSALAAAAYLEATKPTGNAGFVTKPRSVTMPKNKTPSRTKNMQAIIDELTREHAIAIERANIAEEAKVAAEHRVRMLAIETTIAKRSSPEELARALADLNKVRNAASAMSVALDAAHAKLREQAGL